MTHPLLSLHRHLDLWSSLLPLDNKNKNRYYFVLFSLNRNFVPEKYSNTHNNEKYGKFKKEDCKVGNACCADFELCSRFGKRA